MLGAQLKVVFTMETVQYGHHDILRRMMPQNSLQCPQSIQQKTEDWCVVPIGGSGDEGFVESSDVHRLDTFIYT